MNPNDFIMAHADLPYDPLKRKEYYERTKQLKGRKKGSSEDSSTKPVKSDRLERAAQRKQEVEAKVKSLKAKLEKLKTLLKTLTKQAKERAGVDTEEPKKSEASTSSNGPKDKKLTSSEKKDAAKRSKEYYEKNKDTKTESPDKQLESVKAQIKDVQAKIQKIKADLAKSKSSNQKIGEESKP